MTEIDFKMNLGNFTVLVKYDGREEIVDLIRILRPA